MAPDQALDGRLVHSCSRIPSPTRRLRCPPSRFSLRLSRILGRRIPDRQRVNSGHLEDRPAREAIGDSAPPDQLVPPANRGRKRNRSRDRTVHHRPSKSPQRSQGTPLYASMCCPSGLGAKGQAPSSVSCSLTAIALSCAALAPQIVAGQQWGARVDCAQVPVRRQLQRVVRRCVPQATEGTRATYPRGQLAGMPTGLSTRSVQRLLLRLIGARRAFRTRSPEESRLGNGPYLDRLGVCSASAWEARRGPSRGGRRDGGAFLGGFSPTPQVPSDEIRPVRRCCSCNPLGSPWHRLTPNRQPKRLAKRRRVR
jgi:hypothetical protein